MNYTTEDLLRALIRFESMTADLDESLAGLAESAVVQRATLEQHLESLRIGRSLVLGRAMEALYQQAKQGAWDSVLTAWGDNQALAQECAHYVKPSSGWAFLHQAAYFGSEPACRVLIRSGASAGHRATDGQTASGVAASRGHQALADLIARAADSATGSYCPPDDARLLPSSHLWREASPRLATRDILIAYCGTRTRVSPGKTYYVDSFDRVLVGWHGTVSPPLGMAGEPMVHE